MQTIQLELAAEAEGQAELVLGVGALNIIVAAAELQFDPVGQTITQPQFQAAVGIGNRDPGVLALALLAGRNQAEAASDHRLPLPEANGNLNIRPQRNLAKANSLTSNLHPCAVCKGLNLVLDPASVKVRNEPNGAVAVVQQNLAFQAETGELSLRVKGSCAPVDEAHIVAGRPIEQSALKDQR